MVDRSWKEMTRNIFAASVSTAICVSIMNPLDVLRIRWQTQNRVPLSEFLRHNTRSGVLRSLVLPGIGVNAASVALATGIRLGLYPVTRDTLATQSFLQAPRQQHTPGPHVMLLSGFLTGALGFFLATPFFTAKIRAQTFGTGLSGWAHLKKLVLREQHPYRGSSILVARGALFSCGANFGYDQSKRQFRRAGFEETIGVHAISSIGSALIAVTLATPFDMLLTKHQTTTTPSSSPLRTLKTMLQQDPGGILSLYRGWNLFFLRVAPLFLIQLPMYEQVRKLLGMDFME